MRTGRMHACHDGLPNSAPADFQPTSPDNLVDDLATSFSAHVRQCATCVLFVVPHVRQCATCVSALGVSFSAHVHPFLPTCVSALHTSPRGPAGLLVRGGRGPSPHVAPGDLRGLAPPCGSAEVGGPASAHAAGQRSMMPPLGPATLSQLCIWQSASQTGRPGQGECAAGASAGTVPMTEVQSCTASTSVHCTAGKAVHVTARTAVHVTASTSVHWRQGYPCVSGPVPT